MAENTEDMQKLINVLVVWCNNNCLKVNLSKSKVMHFRNPSVDRSNYQFILNGEVFDYVSSYQYLGLVLNEFLDYQFMAKAVARSASRALGLLIVKSKAHGGFQHNIFTKLFDTLVWSVINYGSAIWGTREFSCISAVQNRAMRFYMGVGKYTPNDAIAGDMGWKPPYVKQWTNIFRHWSRCTKMENNRLNSKVFKWSIRKGSYKIKNWSYLVMEMLKCYNMERFCNINQYILDKNTIFHLEEEMFNKYKTDWCTRMDSYGQGSKLRTYKLYKFSYCTEQYLLQNIPIRYRSAFAKFRCGVAPLKIETGRYERKELDERLCINCDNVEDEKHVLLKCPLYEDLRQSMFIDVVGHNNNFLTLSDNEKNLFLFNNDTVCYSVAKTCHNILLRRNSILGGRE